MYTGLCCLLVSTKWWRGNPKARSPSAAKGVLATVGDVQEAILILVVLIHIRHERSCTKDVTLTQYTGWTLGFECASLTGCAFSGRYLACLTDQSMCPWMCLGWSEQG